MSELSKEDIEKMSPEEIEELQKKNCIFCKIASKEIPAKIIYEDKDILCILDINPASEGHILVYPKKHYMILPHLPEDLLLKLFSVVKYISNVLLKSIQTGGTTIFVANGSAAGQKAPHVLVHVFPRRENDSLVKLPKYEMNDESLDNLKKELGKYISYILGNKEELEKISTKTKSGHISKEEIYEEIEKKENHSKKDSTPEKKSEEDIDKKNTKTMPSKKDNKVSLDDIGKLFD